MGYTSAFEKVHFVSSVMEAVRTPRDKQAHIFFFGKQDLFFSMNMAWVLATVAPMIKLGRWREGRSDQDSCKGQLQNGHPKVFMTDCRAKMKYVGLTILDGIVYPLILTKAMQKSTECESSTSN